MDVKRILVAEHVKVWNARHLLVSQSWGHRWQEITGDKEIYITLITEPKISIPHRGAFT
jgi:hypothetical protein